MAFEDIVVTLEPPIGILTFNRPAVLNALRTRLLKEVSEALAEMERNESVRAVVMTGAGEKAFAAGADISELNTIASAGLGAVQSRSGQALTRQIERMSKAVIVAVNGFALGGGCEIAMAGDIIVASENAKFGQPEVNLGLIPGYGGTARTTRRVGKGMASYLCLTGEIIDAREALRIGLVHQIIPLVDLVITHGGNNTTTEAFHFGKPMVVLPLFWDQYDNAQRVHELGYGVRLPTYSFADDDLLRAVDGLLADTALRERMAAIGADIRARDGLHAGAEILERVGLDRRAATGG